MSKAILKYGIFEAVIDVPELDRFLHVMTPASKIMPFERPDFSEPVSVKTRAMTFEQVYCPLKDVGVYEFVESK